MGKVATEVDTSHAWGWGKSHVPDTKFSSAPGRDKPALREPDTVDRALGPWPGRARSDSGGNREWRPAGRVRPPVQARFHG